MLILKYCIIFSFIYTCWLNKHTIYLNVYCPSRPAEYLKVENNYSILNTSNIIILLAQNKHHYLSLTAGHLKIENPKSTILAQLQDS